MGKEIDEALEAAEGHESDLATAAAKLKLAALQKKYRGALERITELEHMADISAALRSELTSKQFKTRPRRRGDEGTAILNVGDWHIDQIVDPEQVNGLNAFNREIADKRIERCAQSAVKMIGLWRNIAPLDELIIVWLGDGFSGHIHDELVQATSMAPPEASVWLMERFLGLVDMLKAEGKFKRIRIKAKYGNHTRTTKKVYAANAHKNNFEWMLFKLMERWRDIDVSMEAGYFSWLDVYGYPIRIHHGNAVRYNSGIGGKVIPIKRAITSKWNKARQAYLDIFGHFHEFEWTSAYISNGSLIGYNEYSAQGFPYEPPTQSLAIMDKRRGLVAALPIFVDEAKGVPHD